MKFRLSVVLSALIPLSLHAQTVTVTSLADAGPGSLRQAIADVPPGGTIVFDPSLSLITLTGGELLIDKDLTITGPGADRLSVAGGSISRVFRIESPANVTIADITIRDGKAADAVAPSIQAENGGGIFNGGTLTLVQVVLVNNRSGDGAQTSEESLSARGGYGGAIFNDHGKVTLIRSTVSDNATGNGGDCVDCVDATAGGGSGGQGGAIYSSGGVITMIRSTFSGNRTGDGGNCVNCSGVDSHGGSGGWGGAVYHYNFVSGDSLIIDSSTISGNWTGAAGSGAIEGRQGLGGGVAVWNTSVRISHSTIVDNNGRIVGGVRMAGGALTVLSSIIAGNAEEGSLTGPDADCNIAGTASYTSIGYNLFGDGTGCPPTGTGDQTIAPQSVLGSALNPLGSNGGPTQTHTLNYFSPAIDQGSCPGVDYDQRGYGGSTTGPRIVDEVHINADDGCDVGATEFVGLPPVGRPLDLIVHFKRPTDWGYPHLHYFSTTPDIGGTSWPGEPMVYEGCGWYKYRFRGAGMAHMVFNGNTTPQTVDLFRSGEGWFDGASNTWAEVNPEVCEGMVVVYPRVFLQGAYEGAGFMSTSLWDSGHLPSRQPYGGAEFADPLKHNGDETWANHIPVTDWSIVELRATPDASSKVATQAAIHQPDGTLGDPITLGAVQFPGVRESSYYVVVRHRNHLPVMSANAVELTAAFSDVYDFALDPSSAYGTNPMVQMPDGNWAMWAADANISGVIDASDYLVWRDATTGGTEGYVLPDFNLDGTANGLDFNLYITNNKAGAAAQVPE